ncbi:MAG: circularly permuted type 2 ATP-grasp protein, partial [Planctomycetaceae bacterium]|nr:circularly permuted type 2 ATP-grasp protein [Planctomycetaceae bacterium]
MDLRSYATDGFWDELFDESLQPRPGAEQLVRRLAAFSHGELAARQRAADKSLLTMGITFNVYGHE